MDQSQPTKLDCSEYIWSIKWNTQTWGISAKARYWMSDSVCYFCWWAAVYSWWQNHSTLLFANFYPTVVFEKEGHTAPLDTVSFPGQGKSEPLSQEYEPQRMPSLIMEMYILISYRQLWDGCWSIQNYDELRGLKRKVCLYVLEMSAMQTFIVSSYSTTIETKNNKPFSLSNNILRHTLLQYLANIYCLQRQQYNMGRQEDPFDILQMFQECSSKVKFATFQSLICSSISICLVPLRKEAMSREKISLYVF